MHPSIDEEQLAASLDDVWRTPVRIKNKFRIKGHSEWVAEALTRLADAGRIERKVEETKGIRKGRGAVFRAQTFETFRRLQAQ
ncbi:hypothetical protein [Bradyrhizobium sp. CCBAU 51753]|uniref:hypothetical protein n=1 Tax=Bradyrhizobium sp. CCBAU 51753 TaxID=1325100 RepID=UPI00188B4E0A|nr:hypothetical protein [Bradyrhizobium sp. CCBAU 51753]QOZ25303.1 hypothetical protein XH93_18180 [Bradyrhizobium sp. CCBAU 51753]